MEAATEKLIGVSDEELTDLLELARGADSVELKLTVPEADQRSTITALELDPLDAQIRQVFFFDTPDLRLNAAGVVARARRVQNRAHDSVVKLRPVSPDEIPSELRASPEMVVELDAMPGGYVCSASMKGRLAKGADANDAIIGSLPLRKLFSEAQRAFFESHAPEGIGFGNLSVLGPIFVLKLKFNPEDAPRKFVAEVWLYPDGTRILELSTKCDPREMFQVAAEARAFLSARGVNLSGEQQTKTRTALEFFSQNLDG